MTRLLIHITPTGFQVFGLPTGHYDLSKPITVEQQAAEPGTGQLMSGGSLHNFVAAINEAIKKELHTAKDLIEVVTLDSGRPAV